MRTSGRPQSVRSSETDPETGVVTTSIFNDAGENRDLQHGLISGSTTREHWSIHPDDPLSATAHIRWEQSGGRNDWRTKRWRKWRCAATGLVLFIANSQRRRTAARCSKRVDERIARRLSEPVCRGCVSIGPCACGRAPNGRDHPVKLARARATEWRARK
jgi:hypothetical protein